MLKFTRSIPITMAALLVACASSSNMQVGDTGSLAGLQEMASTKGAKTRSMPTMGKIREMALKETALSLGAQSALAWRAKYIDDQLVKQSRNLDSIYDFNALVLEHNILPPVLLEGRNTLNLADTQTIRISDRTYKVAKQARFITTPPIGGSTCGWIIRSLNTRTRLFCRKPKKNAKFGATMLIRAGKTG